MKYIHLYCQFSSQRVALQCRNHEAGAYADFENYYNAIVSVVPNVARKTSHQFTFNPAEASIALIKHGKRIRAIEDRVSAVILPNYSK
jgi:hypothetical protein